MIYSSTLCNPLSYRDERFNPWHPFPIKSHSPKVCNGLGTFLWHAFWNQLGPLIPRFGERIIYDSAIHRNAHVAEVSGGGRWNWPIANSVDLIAIKNRCGDYPLDESREDIIS